MPDILAMRRAMAILIKLYERLKLPKMVTLEKKVTLTRIGGLFNLQAGIPYQSIKF